ncbi:MAG: dienelactone hydrolase family protein [Pseudomonadota bacterium]
MRGLRIGGVVVAALVAALGLHTLARHQGWLSDRLSPQALAAFLDPHTVVKTPPGDGPFPAVLLFSGCDGVHENLDLWSDAFLAEGYASVIVDSHTPRDLLDLEAWRLVCAGQLLPGPERSGDVLATMAAVSAQPDIDGDRLTLVGMSHGGWSIMDLMTRELEGEPPVNLATLPDAYRQGVQGVEAVVLVYPWCGLASRARHFPWQNGAPVLFLLAELDVIAPSGECEIVAGSMATEGHPVETVMYAGATHGFDQQHSSPLSVLRFDAEITRDAIARGVRFVEAAAETDGR